MASGSTADSAVGVSQPMQATTRCEILCTDPDGSVVELEKCGTSGVIANVYSRSGSTKRILGSVSLMIDHKSGAQSLKATCKVHSQCICWISNSRNADLLFDWLADGRKKTKAGHADLSTELKKSIGMKVRK